MNKPNNLTPREEYVFEWHYVRGRKPKEISDRLARSISPSRVSQIIGQIAKKMVV